MSETSPSSKPGADRNIDPQTPVTISLRLHEAIGLSVLYERCPPDVDLLDEHGLWWGESVDLAMLRLAEAIATVTGNKEGLLAAGAVRAWFDQHGIPT